VPIGDWTHLAITRNASANKMYLYINGLRVAEDDGRTIDLGRETIPRAGDWLDALLDEAVVFNRVLTNDEIFNHYKAIVSRDPQASNPIPENGATDVLSNIILGWTPGEYADKHDVYLGTVFSDVNEANKTNTRGVLASQNQDANTYCPEGPLDFGQTYYWRVDEVNAPPDNRIYKGYTWSFTTEPFVYHLENITATASSFQTDSGPENTINSSGLDDNDLHGTNPATMWLSSTEPQPTWIRYEFDKAYKLHQMWVWNYNAEFESILGFGLKDVTVEYSENGTDWQVLGDFEFAQAPGEEGYAHNTIVDFNGAAAKYVKLTANSHWGELFQYGLSEVRFFYKPVHARLPKPASDQIGVPLDTVLSWRAGREATSHEVYLSEDMEAVINATALLGTVINQCSYDISPLGLELVKTYYWKVNEVNDIESPASWEGEVWSFTTTEFLVVEDFEKYDNFCNRIFYAWVDGFGHSSDSECNVAPFGGNDTGSTVGNFNAPFAERIIVHEGRQSMPFMYNNTFEPYYSETQRQWDTVQDWTKGGTGSLVVWFYGDADNSAEQLYVAVEDNTGNTKVINHSQPAALQAASWQQWNILLTDFAGVDLVSVKKMYIGVGNRTTPQTGGTGKLYFDDIRLYPLVPVE
jgi:hypothetical protein